ncbi:MAG: sigma-70 family RNA polymerase sigma factor [Planctomycetes bacterium]|nr:sigma-70 family RNA polymerase sigma factor [Planctomycetota bacterium]MBI3846538.1 sigma-70 family RNA polymerase sigma factor [Planctomycetota bacterium]
MSSRLHDARDEKSTSLLARWQHAGDPDALDELLRAEVAVLKSRIRREGKRMLRPSMSATDVAQEVVMGMLKVRRAPRFEDPRALRGYLWKAAWRLLVRRLRKPGRDFVRLDHATSTVLRSALRITGGVSAPEDNERSVALNLMVHLLRPDEREIIDLVYFRQHGIEGAAKRLEISPDAANMRLVRARRKLASKLRHWTDLIG